MRDSVRVPAVVPALDGFRGYAAVLVLVLHCWVAGGTPYLDGGPLRAVVAAGGLAVDYFFVISGFALFLPVVRNNGRFGSMRSYIIRRAARIVPAYYVSLAGLVLLYPMLTGEPRPFLTVGGLLSMAVHLAYLHYEIPAWLLRGVGAPWGVGFGVNGALWSLSIELCFYIALPFVAATYFRRPIVAPVTALAVALVWRMLALHLPPVATLVGAEAVAGAGRPRLFTQFPGYLGHFAFGMTGAVLFVRLWRRQPLASTRWFAASLVQAGSLAVLVHGMVAAGNCQLADACSTWSARYLRDVIPSLAFAVLLVSTCLTSPSGQWLWANPLARWLGDISYGVYLWHSLLLRFFTRQLASGRNGALATFPDLIVFVLPTALLIGWLSRRFVEAPVMAYARAHTASRDTEPLATTHEVDAGSLGPAPIARGHS